METIFGLVFTALTIQYVVGAGLDLSNMGLVFGTGHHNKASQQPQKQPVGSVYPGPKKVIGPPYPKSGLSKGKPVGPIPKSKVKSKGKSKEKGKPILSLQSMMSDISKSFPGLSSVGGFDDFLSPARKGGYSSNQYKTGPNASPGHPYYPKPPISKGSYNPMPPSVPLYPNPSVKPVESVPFYPKPQVKPEDSVPLYPKHPVKPVQNIPVYRKPSVKPVESVPLYPKHPEKSIGSVPLYPKPPMEPIGSVPYYPQKPVGPVYLKPPIKPIRKKPFYPKPPKKVVVPKKVGVIRNIPSRSNISRGGKVSGEIKPYQVGYFPKYKHHKHGYKVTYNTFPAAKLVASVCPYGWIPYAGSCYLFSRERLDWYTAEMKCQYMGGNLVVVESSHENAFLKKVIGKYAMAPGVWMGLNDALFHNSYQWYWGYGHKPCKTFDWFGKEPNYKGYNHHCAMFWSSYGNRWKVFNCYRKMYYVCEINPIGSGILQGIGLFCLIRRTSRKTENNLRKSDLISEIEPRSSDLKSGAMSLD